MTMLNCGAYEPERRVTRAVLFDAVRGAVRAAAEREPGGDGVETIGEPAGEAAQAGRVCREAVVDPGVQNRCELPVFVLKGELGRRVSQPVAGRAVGGAGGACAVRRG